MRTWEVRAQSQTDKRQADTQTHTLALGNLVEAIWAPPGQVGLVPCRPWQALAWRPAIKEAVPDVPVGADLARGRHRRVLATQQPE
jgi:hypothetical protein